MRSSRLRVNGCRHHRLVDSPKELNRRFAHAVLEPSMGRSDRDFNKTASIKVSAACSAEP